VQRTCFINQFISVTFYPKLWMLFFMKLNPVEITPKTMKVFFTFLEDSNQYFKQLITLKKLYYWLDFAGTGYTIEIIILGFMLYLKIFSRFDICLLKNVSFIYQHVYLKQFFFFRSLSASKLTWIQWKNRGQQLETDSSSKKSIF